MKKALLAGVAALFLATPAQAQRCAAGQDAFLNCLPLDHRYGGAGEIPRPQPERAQRRIRTPQGTYSASQYNCVYRYVGRLKAANDPRTVRLQAMAGKRGDTSAAGFDALGHTRDFVSMNSEAHRACGVR